MPLTEKKFYVLVNGFHAVVLRNAGTATQPHMEQRSEEHTSELQSP